MSLQSFPIARNSHLLHSVDQIKLNSPLNSRSSASTNPVLLDENRNLIAGHGRLEAARLLNIQQIPAITLPHLSGAQKAAPSRIADNKLALQQRMGRRAPQHARRSADLRDLGFDLSLTGFADDELSALFADATEGLTDPDDVPEPPAEPVTQLGDVWIMGRHRLLCGDSTSAADVATLTNGMLADLCFTSPPYLRQRDYQEAVVDWDGLMQGVFSVLPVTDEAQLLVNLGMVHRDGEWLPYWDGWIAWMREQGWRRFGWYVWDQGNGLQGDWSGRLAPSLTRKWVFPLQPRCGSGHAKPKRRKAASCMGRAFVGRMATKTRARHTTAEPSSPLKYPIASFVLIVVTSQVSATRQSFPWTWYPRC